MQTKHKDTPVQVINLEAQTLAYWTISQAHNQVPDAPDVSIGDAIDALTGISQYLSPARHIAKLASDLLGDLIKGD